MTTFEALSAKRRKYIEAARDNGFEQGLRKLLADLYPDNAHFIYELLQNAEDAGAREVTFDLQPDGLRVEHDGSKLFDLNDIESITGIGQSTKADDVTRIGKFGVGFKAVFAYTQSPVIHSGEQSFAIHDLFVPVPVHAEGRDGWTTFWFPFDRVDKPADRAVTEVGAALREISRSTLLFLNSIAIIACSLPDGDERLLERRALDEHVIEIESLHEEEGPSYWYRIAGEVAVHGMSYPAAAAFALEAQSSKQKDPGRYAVTPVDGRVFIYFPAVKETSGLKFHIHAPFASTVARDSVRDDPGNDAIVEGIAELIARALPHMSEAGMITDGLLAALPNNNDELPERYALLRARITQAFGVESLTPVFGGGLAPANTLLRSDKNVRSALTIDDANVLRGIYLYVNNPATGWLAERDARAGAFLGSLGVEDFTRDGLTQALARVAAINDDVATHVDHPDYVDDEERADLELWDAWIRVKDEAWLRNFYIMLEALAPRARASRYYFEQSAQDYLDALSSAPLLRVQCGNGVRHVPGPGAYLPTTPDLQLDGLLIDGLAAFEGSDDAERLELLGAFYRHSGAKTWDAAAQLNATFSAYSNANAEITEQHLEDLRNLASLIEDRAVAPSTYSKRPILVAVQRDGTPHWARPSDVFLDEPFAPTGLASLYESVEYSGVPLGRLDTGYLDALPKIAELAKTLGVVHQLGIIPTDVRTNSEFRRAWVERENQNKSSTDWRIPHFDTIVSCGDERLLRELWTLVAAAPIAYTDAAYRSNGSSRRHVMKSQLFQKITSVPWIPDRDGNLRLPSDISSVELAADLPAPNALGLLAAANFGQKAAVDALQLRRQDEIAKKLGFESTGEMQRIAHLRQRDPKRFEALLEELDFELRLPEAPTSAPEQRSRRAGEISAAAPARQYDKRIRSVYVQVPGHLSAARSYLREHYSNGDRIMVCQVCSSSMPFKIAGEYYFEAVQFVKDAKRDLRENRLALCPTCAAKYRHARDTSLQDLRDDLLTQHVENQGSITVDVMLAGDAAKVRFVGKHAIDLQGALRATEGEWIEEDEVTQFENAEP